MLLAHLQATGDGSLIKQHVIMNNDSDSLDTHLYISPSTT